MARPPAYPIARWFRELGRCTTCPKAAVGELMSFRNDVIGRFCARCADREVRAVERYQAKEKTP
jgi:hypothetical protein